MTTTRSLAIPTLLLTATLTAAACSIPSGTYTQTQHDYRGHAIHCTFRKTWHPSYPFYGYGYFTHTLISGPSSCRG
jgi:hypothetical protein